MADAKRLNFITPVGRLVQGDPKTGFGQTHDRKKQPYLNRKTKLPETRYYFALAVPKSTAGTSGYDKDGNLVIGNPLELIAMLRAEGRKGFPDLFDAAGNCTRKRYGPGGISEDDFAYKYIDGDSTMPNQDNRRWCDIEGFPGNWVFKFNTTLPFPFYDMNNNKIDPASGMILRGHWIRVWGNMAPGNDSSKPSVFLNPGAIMHVAYGVEIVGFDTSEVFAGVGQSSLPAGASLTPIASAGIPAGVSQPVSPAPQVPQQYPAPQYSAPQAYQAPVQQTAGPTVHPAPSFLQPPAAAIQPPPALPVPAPAPQPPAAPQRYQASNGQAYTYDELIGYKFTPDQIAALPRVA